MRRFSHRSARGLGGFLALAVAASACGSTSEPGPSKYTCQGPKPATTAYDSGYESCEGNWSHRPKIVECQTSVPRPGYTCTNTVGTPECATDADCAGTPNSYCSFQAPGTCQCVAGCLKDSDCAAGSICACTEVMGFCYEASCTSDADCSDGNLCGSYNSMPSCGPVKFKCQSGDDECASHSDCPSNQSCTVKGGHRVCTADKCYI